jgi:hypothetical protein
MFPSRMSLATLEGPLRTPTKPADAHARGQAPFRDRADARYQRLDGSSARRIMAPCVNGPTVGFFSGCFRILEDAFRFSLLSQVYIEFSLYPPDSSGKFSFSSIQLTSFLVYDHIYTFWSSPVDSYEPGSLLLSSLSIYIPS